jgi:hypothetical protein
MSDPTKPELTLLIKLGSIAVHVDEMLSSTGHPVDKVAIKSLLRDPELKGWVKQMDRLAFLPKKRF